MDWYTRLVSGVLFPLHERLKNHRTTARLRELERTQWQSREEIERLRLERLRALIDHARARVPYYRERLAGASPVQSIGDLTRLPLLEKSIIREQGLRLAAEGAGPLKRCHTGGSTGEPLEFYLGRARISHDVAAKWRATRWWGVDIGDPELVVWGSPIELGTQDRLRRARDRLIRSELLPAFELDDRRIAEALARIQQRRPKMLFGYPSALSLIARHARSRGWRLDDLGIQVAFVTAERLYDNQRADISRAFGCAVANGYGGRDAGFIAHECPAGGMHISAEDVIVEIIDRGGRVLPAGRPGEIVVTHLASADFPFIRYRTGDIGVVDDAPCACGRGLPLLREIQGRSTDFVVAQDGTVMHGLALIYVLRELPGIAQFRIIQESRLATRVELVRGPGFSAQTVSDIQNGLRARLGEAVDIDVATLPFLLNEPNGKFRYVQSKVAA